MRFDEFVRKSSSMPRDQRETVIRAAAAARKAFESLYPLDECYPIAGVFGAYFGALDEDEFARLTGALPISAILRPTDFLSLFCTVDPELWRRTNTLPMAITVGATSTRVMLACGGAWHAGDPAAVALVSALRDGLDLGGRSLDVEPVGVLAPSLDGMMGAAMLVLGARANAAPAIYPKVAWRNSSVLSVMDGAIDGRDAWRNELRDRLESEALAIGSSRLALHLLNFWTAVAPVLEETDPIAKQWARVIRRSVGRAEMALLSMHPIVPVLSEFAADWREARRMHGVGGTQLSDLLPPLLDKIRCEAEIGVDVVTDAIARAHAVVVFGSPSTVLCSPVLRALVCSDELVEVVLVRPESDAGSAFWRYGMRDVRIALNAGLKAVGKRGSEVEERKLPAVAKRLNQLPGDRVVFLAGAAHAVDLGRVEMLVCERGAGVALGRLPHATAVAAIGEKCKQLKGVKRPAPHGDRAGDMAQDIWGRYWRGVLLNYELLHRPAFDEAR